LATAVRLSLVVVLPPGNNSGPDLLQGLEPLVFQVLVAKLAVKAIYVAVMHRPTRLDKDVTNTACINPGYEGVAGELWPIADFFCLWVAP